MIENKAVKKVLCGILTFILLFVCVPQFTEEIQAGQNAITMDEEGTTITLYPGQTKKLQIRIGGWPYSNNVWRSSNTKVAGISSKGVIKAVSPGKTTISGYPKEYSFAVMKCTVVVKKAAITLNRASGTMKVGNQLKLKATVKGASKKVTWKSSDTKIATVKNGVVTARKAGTVVISAKANGKTVKCKIKVTNNN